MNGNFVRGSAVALTAAALLGGCGGEHPAVEAKTNKTVEVHTDWGHAMTLDGDTAVRAICITQGFAPRTVKAEITSGEHTGKTAVDVHRDDLDNTNDPYEASQQTPPQDPFATLPHC